MGFDMYAFGHDAGRRTDADAYFRLNIWGMSHAVDELVRVGVMEQAPCPEFPQPAEFGLTEWPEHAWDDARQVWTLYERSADGWEYAVVEPDAHELAFLMAVRSVEEQPRSGDCHGIPTYKVGSNDGWLVTPTEIRTGVAWADHHEGDGWRQGLTDYVCDFVAWMERTADIGGFRVH